MSRFYLLFWGFLLCMDLNAQEGLMGGGGPSFELDENLFGINARLFYGTDPTFCFGPEVTFFPYQEIDEEYELSVIDLNANAHYIVEISHKLGIYPLGGINYTIEKERLISDTDDMEEVSEFGLNYGLGAHYNLHHFFIFAEFKGVAGQLNDEFFTAGIILPLGKSNEENHQ
ncbi:hypothetical protein [Ulvibacterium sp.]|uniref:hypothetical protein n=1 Tax=Ulvibacterium sp. TaxID=2665914 RepID=UPI003CC6BC0A